MNGTLLGETLKTFRADLEGARETLRKTLQEEFRALKTAGHGEADNPELEQLLALSLKVLDKMLPPAADVIRIRDLLRGGDLGPEALADFHRLETDAKTYRAVNSEPGQALAAFLTAAREALETDRALPDLGEGWRLLAAAQTEQQRSAESFAERLSAAQRAAAPLSSLNSDAALTLRWQLGALSAKQGAHITPKRQAELEASLQETEALIVSLQAEAEATRTVASQLLAGNESLDDLLGGFDFFAAPAKPAAAEKPAELAPAGATQRSELSVPPKETATVQGWLERHAVHEGVAGLALFADHAEALVSGDLPVATKTLQRAVRLTKRRADTVGRGLGRGDASALSVETEGYTLLVFWLTRACSLALVTYAPGWRGVARQSVMGALPELVALLEPVGALPEHLINLN